ncbi:MAG TPA: DUF1800 domain-containing protein [Aggregatilineales bacterium]|nr:DUF1800 domain-containing protein [Anaerolineales bacterium]HRE47089.1 DUF1800 domain-containing protein [Aggregatilineales bacterium]
MNRRHFLKALAGAGAALAGSNVIPALARPDLPAPLRTPTPYAEREPINHVLNRWGFGARPGQADRVRQMGIEAYLEEQLNPAALPDPLAERITGNLLTLDLSVPELFALGKGQGEIAAELIIATLARAVYSERQLYEVMVNFWSEHFSIYIGKGIIPYLKTRDDCDVIRTHALGNFRDLLGASAKSPAMLVYLDNASSRKEHPNENYAREVMELHTITIGNYSEDDVKEVARAFTGWTVARGRGEYLYNPNRHDDGAKTVIGTHIPAGGGEQDGEIILDLLALHPATAAHIASKLCRRFIGDSPSEGAIKAVANAFIASGGEIKPVLRTLFALPEFWGAPPKYKRPFEYVVSVLRGVNAEIHGSAGRRNSPIGEALEIMGHVPFNHPTPDGYSDVGADWLTNLLPRWNFAVLSAYNEIPGFAVDLVGNATDSGAANDFESLANFYISTLLGRTLTPDEYRAIYSFAIRNGAESLKDRALSETVALIAASPAFQYR